MGEFKVVVIGGSAGAVEGMLHFVRELPRDLNAAVFVALHISASVPSSFAEILSRHAPLNVKWATDGERIEAGTVYVAPSDQHLLIDGGHICLGRGPRENGHRPAIDPLFRTAAHSYCERVIGVVLSGNLDDGSLGLQEVRKMGGTAVVQEPLSAPYASMPQNAIDIAGADVVVPVAEIAATIVELVKRTVPTELCDEMPDDIAIGGPAPMSVDERQQGKIAPFGCPDCGGALWEYDQKGVSSYRCRVGHAYTDESLLEGMTDGVERAMWAALRALEEQAGQAQRLARRMKARGHTGLTERFQAQALESEERAATIRQALLNTRGN